MKKVKPEAKSVKPKKEKQRAAAFLNWKIFRNDGSPYKGDKGLAIFQNPEYPSKGEDLLVSLAEQNGGAIKLKMEVEIRINTPSVPENLDEFAKIE